MGFEFYLSLLLKKPGEEPIVSAGYSSKKDKYNFNDTRVRPRTTDEAGSNGCKTELQMPGKKKKKTKT